MNVNSLIANLPTPVLLTLAGIYGVLMLATLVVWVFCQNIKEYQELQDRIQSWWLMVVVFSLVLFSNSLSRLSSLLF